MAQLIVRNVDQELVRRLRLRAAANGRSGEEEHRRILEEVLVPEAAGDFWAEAARLRAETAGRGGPDSTDLVREERDRRAGGG
jgi:antitoxin FitA